MYSVHRFSYDLHKIFRSTGWHYVWSGEIIYVMNTHLYELTAFLGVSVLTSYWHLGKLLMTFRHHLQDYDYFTRLQRFGPKSLNRIPRPTTSCDFTIFGSQLNFGRTLIA